MSVSWATAGTGFDQAASAAAVHAARRAITTLEDVLIRDAEARLVAVDEWCGPHRREFDERFVVVQRLLVDALAALHRDLRLLVAGEHAARQVHW